ncbi:MAG: Ig-like domain-containing protein [Bacteroidota bacterium]
MISRLLTLSGLFAIYSCAIQVPPQGGDKDIDPPKLLSAIPLTGSTGFSAREIEFVFDENIQVKDLINKLVISPPFKSNPLAKVRKNRLVVSFNDSLVPNTTYCFNFGDAISDLNEGNQIKDFKYVVSTGSFIDSFSVSGKVIRAEDLKPEKSVLVMLYPTTADDSAPYNSLPAYFTRCTEKGIFAVENVASGVYKVFALSDINQDYRYSDPSDRIAFIQQSVTAGDSGILLRSFAKRPLPAVAKATADGPGRINVFFNSPEPQASVRWRTLDPTLAISTVSTSVSNDSVSIFYTRLNVDTAQVLVDFKDHTDTFDLTLKTYDPTRGSKSGFFLSVKPQTENGYLAPGKPLAVRASHPVSVIDTSLMSLEQEGTKVGIRSFVIADSSRRIFLLDADFFEEKRYTLEFLPGTFKDIYGRTNDTLEESFQVKSVTDYGTLRLNLDITRPGNYLIQVVDEKDNVFRTESVRSDTVLFFQLLNPGTYRLKTILDENGNGRWDPGDDLEHRLPELGMYHRDQVPVRANWDVEIKWAIQP